MEYKESFWALCHGTDEESAEKIVQQGFVPGPGVDSWCGKGIYFYDIKSKAWWSAQRTCSELRKKKGKRLKGRLVYADIIDLPKKDIFDSRIYNDLREFEQYINVILEEVEGRLEIDGITDENERIIHLRAMLIDFYAAEKKKKLVIGAFQQRPQKKYVEISAFADSYHMVFGIEIIYCVKDINILSSIRLYEGG